MWVKGKGGHDVGGGGGEEGELGLYIKYINVYTLYDIESQISSTHLVTT